jgi:hypothetical protein
MKGVPTMQHELWRNFVLSHSNLHARLHLTDEVRFPLRRLEGRGGQGNALTGQFYVIDNQDPALKAVQAKFPNVDIKAIQDDITIFGYTDA